MNRTFAAFGRAFGSAALFILTTSNGGEAQQTRTEPQLSVTRDGDRAIVQVETGAPAAASLSELFVLEDRTRIYLLLEGITANIEAPSNESVMESGLLAVEPELRDGSLRIAVDIAMIGEYALDTDENGAALWLRKAADVAAVPAPDLDHAKGTHNEEGTGQSSLIDRTRTTAAAGAKHVLREAADAARTIGVGAVAAAAAVRPISLQLGAGALLLLLPIAAWRINTMRRATVEREAPRNERSDAKHRPDARTQDARLWAAKTLAQEGAQPAEIAARTGLSRDAAALLALTLDAAKAAGHRQKLPAPGAVGSTARA